MFKHERFEKSPLILIHTTLQTCPSAVWIHWSSLFLREAAALRHRIRNFGKLDAVTSPLKFWIASHELTSTRGGPRWRRGLKRLTQERKKGKINVDQNGQEAPAIRTCGKLNANLILQLELQQPPSRGPHNQGRQLKPGKDVSFSTWQSWASRKSVWPQHILGTGEAFGGH